MVGGSTAVCSSTCTMPSTYTTCNGTSGGIPMSFTTITDNTTIRYGNVFAHMGWLSGASHASCSSAGTGTNFIVDVVAPASGTMSCSMARTDNATYRLDPYLFVKSSCNNGSCITYDDDSAGYRNALVSFSVSSGSHYYVFADPLSIMMTGADSFNVRCILPAYACPGTQGDFYGNVFSESGDTSISQNNSNRKSSKDQVWEVTPPVGGTMQCEVLDGGTHWDTYLDVMTGDCRYGTGTYVGGWDDGHPQGGNQTLTGSISVNAGQKYWLIVEAYSSGSGEYTIRCCLNGACSFN